MPFTKELPEWNAPGVKPPKSKIDNGWQPGDKPPADWHNFLQSKTYGALKELQEKAGEVKTVNGQLPDSTGNVNVNVDTSKLATKQELQTETEARVAHQADYVKHPADGGTTAGTSTAYTCSTAPAIASLVDKIGIVIQAHTTSGSNPTLNWNGTGAKPIKKPNGNAATLATGGIYTLRYSVNSNSFILQGEGASGNATASDLLSGKTASTDAGDIVGTMVNNGAMTITPGVANKPITAGYHNGSGYVQGDSDLIASNIKSGINIFGVNGSVVPSKSVVRTGTDIVRADMFTLNITNLPFKPDVLTMKNNNGFRFSITVFPDGKVFANTESSGTWDGSSTYSNGTLTIKMSGGIFRDIDNFSSYQYYAFAV